MYKKYTGEIIIHLLILHMLYWISYCPNHIKWLSRPALHEVARWRGWGGGDSWNVKLRFVSSVSMFSASWMKNIIARFHRLNPSFSWQRFAIVSSSLDFLKILLRRINHCTGPVCSVSVSRWNSLAETAGLCRYLWYDVYQIHAGRVTDILFPPGPGSFSLFLCPDCQISNVNMEERWWSEQ